MSSILDALRKLEEQKSVRKQRPVDVMHGLVRHDPAAAGIRVRTWQIGVVVALVALISTLVTFLVLRPAAAPTPVTLKPAAPVGAAVGQTPLPLPPPVSATPAPALTAAKPFVLPAPPVVKAAPPSKPIITREAKTLPPVPSVPEMAPERQVMAEPRPTASLPAPTFKVTGIGWQKDAAARFVVINGTALSEGGTIDGARIEEILPDKVRVKIDGKVQEIGLGSK